MTIWIPDLSHSSQPTYLAIVDAIGDAIRLGQLRPGDPLPTHRLLADLLGVNVSTVTRAYREAARRRLVGGEVGRGTYVLGVASEAALFALQQRPEGGVIDLSLNMPPVAARDADLAAFTARLGPVEAARLLHYPSPGETLLHRQAAAAWLQPARRGGGAGGHRGVCRSPARHGHRPQPLPGTGRGGLRGPGLPGPQGRGPPLAAPPAPHGHGRGGPSARGLRGRLPERCCGSPWSPRPCTTRPRPPWACRAGSGSWSIARKWDVILVEEDVYGLLQEDAPPPLAALAPERVLYLTGLSKTVAPGLRIGYLLFPPGLRSAHARRRAPHHLVRLGPDHGPGHAVAAGRHRLAPPAGPAPGAGGAPPALPEAPPGLPLARRAPLPPCLAHLAPGRRPRSSPSAPWQPAWWWCLPASSPPGGCPRRMAIRISIGTAPDRRTLAEGLSRLAALQA